VATTRPATLAFDPPVATRFRGLTLTLSAERGQRVTQSEVLAALLILAEREPEKFRAALAPTTPNGDTP